MLKRFDKEVDKLKRMTLALAAVVEDNLSKAVTAVVERDPILGHEVAQSDEAVDRSEVEVEEECLKILALHQPVAHDLRYLIAVLKLNNDLERIGDLAVNIAERVESISAHAEVATPIDLQPMAAHVRSMVSEALDSLVNLDEDLASKVLLADDRADDMHRDNFRRIESAILETPVNVSVLTNYLSVSRYLERIADHSTNIAEDVIYLVSGKIVRHKS